MNKKAIIALVLIVLALLFGYFTLTKSSKNSNQDKNSETSSEPKSLKDLLAGGVAQKCTFSTTSDSGANEGTTYVSKGKVRSDFLITTSGKKIGSHMIVDGNTSYMWMDGEKNGYKMSFDMTSDTQAAASPSSQDYSKGEISADSKMDYKCSAWVVDSSVFVTPSDVKFMEFNIPTAAPQNGNSSSGNSSQCSYCASLTGDSKSQCLTALGCK